MAQNLPFALASANKEHPYNPFTAKDKGDPDDAAMYILPPGVAFYQPWLAIPNGPAFVWPLGLEGFGISIEPTLGIHRYYGGNAVYVNVVHLGEERISMSGNFIGESSKDSLQQLRQVVYQRQPVGGKILYLPGLLSYAQRVAVSRASFDHDQDSRGKDMTYTIEFVRTGIESKYADPDLASPTPQPTTGPTRASTHVFVVTATVNTLRKIAVAKKVTWNSIYNKNITFFQRGNVPAHSVPDWKIPLGTRIYF